MKYLLHCSSAIAADNFAGIVCSDKSIQIWKNILSEKFVFKAMTVWFQDMHEEKVMKIKRETILVEIN